jgi:putative membrane protein
MTSLATLPSFLAYFCMALGLVLVFLAIYVRLTPYDEWALIRAGNSAAALSLAGATFGFCLPLASVIAHAVSLPDMLVWAVVALAVQLLWFTVLRLFRREICEVITRADMAGAIVVATGSVTVGLLNAACLTY